MENVISSLYKEAVDTFGIENQLAVTMGELAECSAEIAKSFIKQRELDEPAMLLEMADVCIMMSQMHYHYGDKLTNAINIKLKKVRGHLDAS